MKIVLPKAFCDIDSNYGPIFFLAGPVIGGDDWQTACCDEINSWIPSFHAALPCHYPSDHPLMQFRMSGHLDHFDRQLSWERHYMEMAAMQGCLIFWLPCESRVNPRNDGYPYAMDTRGELGEWRGRMMRDRNLQVVVGAEAEFHGLSQIQRNFNQALERDFPIYPTLEETVKAAVNKVR